MTGKSEGPKPLSGGGQQVDLTGSSRDHQSGGQPLQEPRTNPQDGATAHAADATTKAANTAPIRAHSQYRTPDQPAAGSETAGATR